MPQALRRLLIVSYDFPPSSVGIWRTLKFCRYMPKFGWFPSVLTVREVRSPAWDEEPLKELPEGTEIRRTGSLDINRVAWKLQRLDEMVFDKPKGEPVRRSNPTPTNSRMRSIMDVARRWLWVPDDRCWWAPFAVAEGKRWLSQTKFDAIYSTSFPHTSHVVAADLARAFRLPYIADFRDIWIGNYQFYNPPTAWHDRKQRRLERFVVRTAGRVISATEPITRDFLERYPEEPPEKFDTVLNGYDLEDFQGINPCPRPETFTITYAGLMYGQTSPKNFFAAVSALLAHQPRWRKYLRLRFMGAMIEPYQRLIQQMGLSDVTVVEPYLPHREALQAMVDADALLLLVAKTPGSHIMLTQKVFEYVAARRPILALVPEGAARDFLEGIGEGSVAAPDSPILIEQALERLLYQWRAGNKQRVELPENKIIRNYERARLTKRLCDNLDAIARD